MSLIAQVGKFAAEAFTKAVISEILQVVERALASDEPMETARFEAKLAAHRLANEAAANLVLAAKRRLR